MLKGDLTRFSQRHRYAGNQEKEGKRDLSAYRVYGANEEKPFLSPDSLTWFETVKDCEKIDKESEGEHRGVLGPLDCFVPDQTREYKVTW